ncbi:MAG: hypothetical protein NTV86_20440 [Planctomycetota bacterium]|nr:hypothetical protein [Planctomycetota bacterium]
MQLLCGKCGRTTEVDDQTLEAVIKCSSCGHEIPVPGRGEDLLGAPEDVGAGEEDFARQAREAMDRKIRVICGACRRGLKASMRMAGAVIRCPACGRKVRIPFPEEAQETPTAAEVGIGALANGPAQSDDDVMVDEPAKNLLSDLEDARTAPGPEGVASAAPVFHGRRASQGAPHAPAISTRALLTVVGLALAAVGGWVWFSLFTNNKIDSPNLPVVKTPTSAPVIAAGVAVKPTTVPVRVGPRDPEPKAERAGGLLLTEARADVFLANGQGVAPPGMVYLKVRLAVIAGEEALAIQSGGNDVRLSAGGKEFASLGRPGPFAPVSDPLRLAPGEKGNLQVVFLVPEQALAGGARCEVAVAALPALPLKGIDLPTAAPLVVGETYRESPPRNLRPLLRDPVMRAIQAAGDQELAVGRRDGALEVSIPRAEVSGLAKPVGGGAYDLTLFRQGDPKGLRCTLRAVKAAGKASLVLYLADEPFHQICYVLPDRPADPPPAPVPPKPEGNGKGNGGEFFGPGKSSATPAPKPPAKSGGGLFDFGN